MHRSFYLHNIVYYLAGLAAVLFAVSYFFPPLFRIAGLVILLLAMAVLTDAMLLYMRRRGISGRRITTDRFSIGDDNKVLLEFQNHYGFPARIAIIDELPAQFQERKWLRRTRIESNETGLIEYRLRPQTRGEYDFGNIIVFVSGPLQLVK